MASICGQFSNQTETHHHFNEPSIHVKNASRAGYIVGEMRIAGIRQRTASPSFFEAKLNT
jgi:hypothetical protein